MGHGHYITTIEPWTVLATILGVLALLIFIVYIFHRKRMTSDGLSPIERKKLDYPERNILSMLRQKGAPLIQTDIMDSMSIEFEEFVEAINELELEKLIKREWNMERNTYTVVALPGKA